MKSIKEGINIPLVADIHFDYRLAIAAIENGADKIRINPGNIGSKENLSKVVQAAKVRGIPIRVGVNSGSLEKDILKAYGGPVPEALVKSAVNQVRLIEELGYDQLVVSIKSSNILSSREAYRLAAEALSYPLHIGITEAGTLRSGTIKSSVGLGLILADGIGDTLRVSLTGDPIEEIYAAKTILRSLELIDEGVEIISCPTCGRTDIDLISLTEEVERRCQKLRIPIKIAVMGCAVNGPGEAREADIGIAGGKGEGLIFKKGEILRKVKEDELLTALMEEIDKLTMI